MMFSHYGANAALTAEIQPERYKSARLKTANTPDELQQSTQLVRDTYIKKGYLRADQVAPESIRAERTSPQSRTLVAERNGTVVATLTLIPDSLLGLPMDEIYRHETDALRRRGRQLAELSGLSAHERFRGGGGSCCLGLMKLAYFHAQRMGVQDLCIAVNPRHRPFYQRVLFFEDLGDGKPRPYPRVSNNPACGQRLRLEGIEERIKKRNRRLHRFFFRDDPIVNCALENELALYVA